MYISKELEGSDTVPRKTNNDLSLLKEMFDKHSQDVIDEFLSYYGPLSCKQYESAIYNMLFEAIGKTSILDLTCDDYEIALKFYNTDEKNQLPQDKYRACFFKYLYAFDIIKNQDGFEKKFFKEACINHFSKDNNKDIKEYKPDLEFDELERIEQYIDMECKDSKERMKASFICYMLYYANCSKTELLKMDVNSYKDGKIVSNINKEYAVPDKYDELFKRYLNNASYNGFSNLNDIVSKLGRTLQIKDLTPQIIINARNQNSMHCSLCGESYLNSISNWVSINNKLVCFKCAENLKKNFNYEINEIKNIKIKTDKIENNIAISSIIYTFDELRSKFFNKKIDYLKLHEFQIEIGKLGEAYVYDFEREKLKKTKYLELVDNTPAKDGSNGFDILSYDLEGNKLYIEVKTEAGLNDNDFYMSENEINTGKKLIKDGEKYIIYRVHNVLAENKKDIKIEIVEDVFNNSDYNFKECLWKVSKA